MDSKNKQQQQSSINNDNKILELINKFKIAIQNGDATTTINNNNSNTDLNPSLFAASNMNNLSNQTFNYIINWLKQQSQIDTINNNQQLTTTNNNNEVNVVATVPDSDVTATASEITTTHTTIAMSTTTQLNKTNNKQQQQQQQITTIEKVRKLEIEKLNLQYQVKLLKQQILNTPSLQSQQQQQQQQILNSYIDDTNNSNIEDLDDDLLLSSIYNKNKDIKQQQQQQQQQFNLGSFITNGTTSTIMGSNNNNNNSNNGGGGTTTTNVNNLLTEIQLLKAQLRSYEEEREYYCAKLKEIEDENSQLKNKYNDNCLFYKGNNYLNHIDEKDEIERLKKNIYDLVKLNEEKDRKIDELTKQVSRFKRIQEIVLSAQNGAKNKNLDIDFDNSDSNSIPSINSDKENMEQQKQQRVFLKPHITSSNGMLVNGGGGGSNGGTSNDGGLLNNIQSSSSTSSTSSSSATTTTPATAQTTNNNPIKSYSAKNLTTHLITIPQNQQQQYIEHQHQQQQQQQQFINEQLNDNRHHYNTLPSSVNNTQSTSLSHYLRNLQQQQTSTSANTLTSISSTTATLTMNNHQVTSVSQRNHSVNDINSGYISDGPQTKYSLNLNNRKLASNEALDKHKGLSSSGSAKGLKSFFGKLIRTSSGNIRESSPQLKRGGFRATAGARLQYEQKNGVNINNISQQSSSITNLLDIAFAKYDCEQVCKWMQEISFEMYVNECKNWIKNGLQLLQATQNDYEKHLGMKNPLHRKRLHLYLQSICAKSISSSNNQQQQSTTEQQTTNSPQSNDNSFLKNLYLIDYHWVTKWLDDIGLPQYKDYFQESRVDGLVLYNLTNEDLIYLNVHSELHHLSIKHAIHVLRINNFNPNCLKRRPTYDDKTDKADVINWTNHRVMEWLRSIDLSEYSSNLRGSGVHGGLMVFEARFNSTILADILSIPTSKTLLRRHLSTHFIELIGSENQLLKREAELQPTYQPLNAANKIKLVKRGLFSHKRTKSTENQDLLSQFEISKNYSLKTINDRNQFKNKLSILSQENVPTSIV